MTLTTRESRPDPGLASLSRRLAFAGGSWFFFDRLFCGRALRRIALVGSSQTARIPDHALRIGFDLLECIRTGSRVPAIGNPELAMLDVDGALPQHPRYRGYWYDAALHSSVGMIIGVDLIRHDGKYYILELNHGPSLNARRRALYDTPFDPIVSELVFAAREHGFTRIVPIAFAWSRLWVEEFERAGREFGLTIVPTDCPVEHPGLARIVALPDPLEPKTMYVIHSGMMTPLCRYVDDKWYTSKWLAHAIEHDLPKDSRIAIPRTRDSFFWPDEDHGERWPNLVVKLASGAKSRSVIAGRFRDEADARRTLGLTGGVKVPRRLRLGFLNRLVYYGRERLIYQSFVPPELDAKQHAQLLRLHLFVSPLRTAFLSAHGRVSTRPLPERAPRGLISDDDRFIFNDAEYRSLPEETENELREVAAQLGQALQSAIVRRFRTS